MKILFLNYEYPPLGGGAANATKFLLSEYANDPALEVDLVTSALGATYERERVGENVIIHRIPIGKRSDKLHHQSMKDLVKYSFAGYDKADELMSLEHYDVIHAFFGVPCGVMAYYLSKKYEVPYIVSLRGSDVPGYSDRFTLLYIALKHLVKRVWSKASAVVCNSQGLKELALKTNPAQEISIIPNGVDTSVFYPDLSKRDPSKIVITAGATRLTERKGLNEVIEAVAQLKDKFPNLLFEVMGEGSDRERLENKARELGVADHVIFLGRIASTETLMFYQRADIFVLPSANEGMSNALLEALACGLPAIVTDTGGSQELVSEGVNGLYIEPQNVESIVEALTVLVDNQELRAGMGRASRSKAETLSWKRAAQSYKTLYQYIYENTVAQV